MPTPATVQIVASIILVQAGKYLLVQEARSSINGLWNFPGGKVDEGESFAEAAIREAKEELGLIVELTEALPVLHPDPASPVFHHFLANITGGKLTLQASELMDCAWLTRDQIAALGHKLRGGASILASIDYLEARQEEHSDSAIILEMPLS